MRIEAAIDSWRRLKFPPTLLRMAFLADNAAPSRLSEWLRDLRGVNPVRVEGADEADRIVDVRDTELVELAPGDLRLQTNIGGTVWLAGAGAFYIDNWTGFGAAVRRMLRQRTANTDLAWDGDDDGWFVARHTTVETPIPYTVHARTAQLELAKAQHVANINAAYRDFAEKFVEDTDDIMNDHQDVVTRFEAQVD